MNQEPMVRHSIDDRVAKITLSRPTSLNALNSQLLRELSEHITVLSTKREVGAIVLTGDGDRAFVAGADIAEMEQAGPAGISQYVELGQGLMRAIETVEVPVIAAVNGFALGGGLELALACDLIIASKKARLGQPEVNLGIIPGFGGTQRLIQRCGVGAARYLVYTGELLSADEGLRIGLVDRVVEPAELMTTACGIAKVIASKGPLAVREAKRVIRQSQEMALLGGLRLEVESFVKLFDTKDRVEGMKAFLEKREAKFEGR
ncbi:MAG: enoyl-CoA hydratase-related protein [Bdellovibrionota bacterium]|nr:MAG: enoyl-CoA hydratase-related protein [Bdellovibrionota bacterium]